MCHDTMLLAQGHFLHEVVQMSSKATWEQLLELHAALYAIILRGRYNSDRSHVLCGLQVVSSKWSRDNGLA